MYKQTDKFIFFLRTQESLQQILLIYFKIIFNQFDKIFESIVKLLFRFEDDDKSK